MEMRQKSSHRAAELGGSLSNRKVIPTVCLPIEQLKPLGFVCNEMVGGAGGDCGTDILLSMALLPMSLECLVTG